MRANDERLTLGHLAALLNRCIAIGCDAEKGYGAASTDAHAPALRAMLAGYEGQRAAFVAALQSAVDELGEAHRNQGTRAGVLHRGWTELRLVVEGRRRDATVLDECIRGDTAALHGYDDVLRWAGDMPLEIRELLTLQRDAIARALIDVKVRVLAAAEGTFTAAG
jgi:uncharacterized protein (TIGR02284 family)